MKTKLTMQMTDALNTARDAEITGLITLNDGEYQNLLTGGLLPEKYIKSSQPNEYSRGLYSHKFIGELANIKVTTDNGVGELVLQELKSCKEFSEITMDKVGFKVEFNHENTQNEVRENESGDQGFCGMNL